MPTYEIEQHFVTFMSPGMLEAQRTTKKVEAWDTLKAVEIAEDMQAAHGASPYGFRFTTRARTAEDLDSTVIAQSSTYYMGGLVETLDQVKTHPEERRILIANMECNHWERVVTTQKGYRWTQPLYKDDVVLDMGSL